MINVTAAFSMGIGGSLSERAADVYNRTMGEMFERYKGLSGWIGGAIESATTAHEKFMNSRMWEFSNRIGRDGHYVGRFEIGYLSEVEFQQEATGFMRNYIMANPAMMALYMEDRISGYDGDFSDLCNGLGRDNYFYNKAMDGMVHMVGEDMLRTHYNSSRDGFTHLSGMERMDIKRTWNASNQHIAKGLFDPTSVLGGEILSPEQVEELRRQEESEE